MRYVVAGLVVILLQALLILQLLLQRRRNQKSDLSLRESEERFRLMADTTPSLIWMCDRQGKVIYLNQRRIEFTGRDPKAGFGDTWTMFITMTSGGPLQIRSPSKAGRLLERISASTPRW